MRAPQDHASRHRAARSRAHPTPAAPPLSNPQHVARIRIATAAAPPVWRPLTATAARALLHPGLADPYDGSPPLLDLLPQAQPPRRTTSDSAALHARNAPSTLYCHPRIDRSRLAVAFPHKPLGSKLPPPSPRVDN